MTDNEPDVPPGDEAPTQELRRTPAPVSGPLDLTSDRQLRPSVGPRHAERTEILSIDDLMDGGERVDELQPLVVDPYPAAATVGPPAPTAPPPVAPPPVAPPAIVRRGRPPSRSAPRAREVRDRLLTDASAMLSRAGRQAESWLRTDDNALIVATTIIAVLLLVAVAAF